MKKDEGQGSLIFLLVETFSLSDFSWRFRSIKI